MHLKHLRFCCKSEQQRHYFRPIRTVKEDQDSSKQIPEEDHFRGNKIKLDESEERRHQFGTVERREVQITR